MQIRLIIQIPGRIILQLVRRFPRAKTFLLGVAYRFRFLGLIFLLRRKLGSHNSSFSNEKSAFLGSPIADREHWNIQREKLERTGVTTRRFAYSANFVSARTSLKFIQPSISVISSLYQSDAYISTFLGDLVLQDNFEEIEFYLVLVKPSNYVLTLVRSVNFAHPNVRYEIVEELIGIYQAWNIAINKTSAEIVTNANADDIRKHDSIIFQARYMSMYPWIDILYQDIPVAYEFDTNWESLERIDSVANVGSVTYAGLVLSGFNYPHHAPAWRRSLHAEIGLFDENYESAGDYEFWIRCAIANKTFFKTRYRHAAYFLNPHGISTSPESKGAEEAFEIQRKFAPLAPSRLQIRKSTSIGDLMRFHYEDTLTHANHLIVPDEITEKFFYEILELRKTLLS